MRRWRGAGARVWGVSDMRAIEVVRRQLDSIHKRFTETAAGVTDAEWTARALPGANLPGFTLWHMARGQDWGVHTLIRGVPEVIADARWASVGGPGTPSMGLDMTLEQADAVARSVTRADVLDYHNAVHARIVAWVATLADDDLDATPDSAAHQAAIPAYQHPAYAEEAGGSTLTYLVGPCFGHMRGHLGELETLLHAMRAG